MVRRGRSGRLSPRLRCRWRFRARFLVTRGWLRNPTGSRVRPCPGLAVFGCRLADSARCGTGRPPARSVPIGGLPLQRSGYQFIRAAGGWAVQAAPGAQAVCGSCAAPRRVLFPGRSRAVGNPGGAGGRGGPGRRWRAVADQLPARCRAAHCRRHGAGSQHHWPTARAAAQAPGRVPDRAGDGPRPAAGTGGPAVGNDGLTSCGIQPLRSPAAPLME